MKIGIAGTGAMAGRFIAAVKDKVNNVVFTAACDVLEEQRRQFKQKYPTMEVFSDYDEMLKSDIDAIYICTPVSTHVELSLKAARAGKHVLCEKPMALDIGECQKMIDAHKESGTILQIGYMMRFHPIHQYIKQQISSGELGNIQYIHVERTAFIDFKAIDIPKHRLWFVQKEKSGGGAFMDLGCHVLDLLIYLVDDKVKDANLRGTIDPDLGVENTAFASLEFEKNTVGSVLASWQVPLHDNIIQVYGDKACISAMRTLGPYIDGRVELIKDDNRTEVRIPYKNHYISELEHFRDCAEQGTEPVTSGANCIESERTRGMLYESFQG